MSRVGPGEMGMKVELDEEQTEIARQLQISEGFNKYISDMISLDRSLPDTRPPL